MAPKSATVRETEPAPAGAAAQSGGANRQPPRLSGRNNYSLFVSSMKLLLPALAAGLVLLVIAWPQIMPDVSRSGLNWQKVARDHAKTLNMLNARYSGVDENNQPFNIAADLATQAPRSARRSSRCSSPWASRAATPCSAAPRRRRT